MKYLLVEGELIDIMSKINQPVYERYRLVQILPKGTGGNVQAILVDDSYSTKSILKELLGNIETTSMSRNKSLFERLLSWVRSMFKRG